jgi:hypothetical protein
MLEVGLLACKLAVAFALPVRVTNLIGALCVGMTIVKVMTPC